MTDPLGQSQVLPYLVGLSKKGYSFVLLSFEKSQRFEQFRHQISEICEQANIDWHPVSYTKKPPVLSTLWDVRRMKKKAKQLHKIHKFDLLHCRSHVATLAGKYLNQKFNLPYIFDMRGFYADERVDGGLWNLKNPLFRMIYRYFKNKESYFLKNATYTISLTKAGKEIIEEGFNEKIAPIEVIPCCADLNHFDYKNIDEKQKNKLKTELGILAENRVVTYIGSLGTWYLTDEIVKAFAKFRDAQKVDKFLVVSGDDLEILKPAMAKYKVSEDEVIIRSSPRKMVPLYISLSDFSIFFIKPVFSKKASSPTKFAELLGMGVPVLCNADVGDMDSFFHDYNLGHIMPDFEEKSFENAVLEYENMMAISKETLREVAENLFSLTKGVELYSRVYKSILK